MGDTRLSDVVGWMWHDFDDVLQTLIVGTGAAVGIVIFDFALMAIARFGNGSGFVEPQSSVQWVLLMATLAAAGIVEELTFRGYLLKQFEAWMPWWLAVWMQAALFAMAHGGDQSWTGFTSKFASGALFAYLARRSGSLLPAMAAHAILDLGIGGNLELGFLTRCPSPVTRIICRPILGVVVFFGCSKLSGPVQIAGSRLSPHRQSPGSDPLSSIERPAIARA